MASKQPRRSDLTSDLKSMTQTTYAAMFVWTLWPSFGQMIKKEEERRKKEFVSTRPVGFAAGKNSKHLAFPSVQIRVSRRPLRLLKERHAHEADGLHILSSTEVGQWNTF